MLWPPECTDSKQHTQQGSASEQQLEATRDSNTKIQLHGAEG